MNRQPTSLLGPAGLPGEQIVRLAAHLTPSDRRDDWIAEWIGELHHAWYESERRGREGPGTHLLLSFRALGAFRDAISLRRRQRNPMMLGTDLRHALRTVVRRPAFSTIVVVTLALGIGATTAIFSAVNAVLLRALPYPDPERLVVMRGVPTNGDVSKVTPSSSWPDYVDFRTAARSFTEVGAASSTVSTITGTARQPSQVSAAAMSSSLFRALGVAPALGRGIGADDEDASAPSVVVLGQDLWRTRFGGDSGRIGETLQIDGVAHTIVGVMPPGFDFPNAAQLWTPLRPRDEGLDRGVHRLRVVGRLAPGVTHAAANVEARAIFARLEQQNPQSNALRTVVIEPLAESSTGSVRPVLLMLFGAVGLVLLIVCTNVANLFLARTASREREVALRLALGAGRGRIARELLLESVMLSVGGGLIGLVLAIWGVRALVAAAPTNIPRASEIGVDLPVLGFVLGVSVLTGIVFGAIPALRLGAVDANGPLKEGSHTIVGNRGTRRIRQTLVVAEVALAVVLVIGAGLLIESLVRLQRVDPGFDPRDVIVSPIALPPARYGDPARVLAYYDRVTQRVAAIPGVRSVALALEHPMSPGWTTSFAIIGRPAPAHGQEPEARMRPVSPGYFATAGIRMIRGRDISERDRGSGPGVVVINNAFAKLHFPNEDPIGRRLGRSAWWPNTPTSFEIIGVIADERFLGLSVAADPAMYFPHAQAPFNDMNVIVKASGRAGDLIPAIRSAIWSVDRDIPLDDVRLMEDLVRASLARPRFVGQLLGLFAGAALLLAAMGIYGVLAYTVAQRTPEIGIRMALGAQRRTVLAAVVGQGIALASVGIAIGSAAALLATRALSGMLFGVTATNPVTFAGVAAVIAAVAALAAYLPARRASRVDPVIALRH